MGAGTLDVGQAITAALQEQAARGVDRLFPRLWMLPGGRIVDDHGNVPTGFIAVVNGDVVVPG